MNNNIRTPIDAITEIESWYTQQCDSSWEHQYGITIQTIDNPGWEIKIDLLGTPYSNLRMNQYSCSRSESDWICCKIENGIFYAYGGPTNLGEMLEYFINMCKAQCGCPTDACCLESGNSKNQTGAE